MWITTILHCCCCCFVKRLKALFLSFFKKIKFLKPTPTYTHQKTPKLLTKLRKHTYPQTPFLNTKKQAITIFCG